MLNFYFIYVPDDEFPYQNGWTTVTAPDYEKACEIFRIIHPDVCEGVLNCEDVYCETDVEFKKQFSDGCYDAFEQEHIYYAFVEKPIKVEINFFDEEITYPDCTVQILRNSVTGEESVGWRNNRNEKIGGKVD